MLTALLDKWFPAPILSTGSRSSAYWIAALFCGWPVQYCCKVIQLDSENLQGGCYFPFKWIRSGRFALWLVAFIPVKLARQIRKTYSRPALFSWLLLGAYWINVFFEWIRFGAYCFVAGLFGIAARLSNWIG